MHICLIFIKQYEDDSSLQSQNIPMEYFQSKESLQTFKPSAEQIPPLTRRSESRHRTSYTSSNNRDILNVSEKRQYNRMKALFRTTASHYYDREIKNILQEEVRKIKQKEKVKNIIDNIKSPENKQNIRARHHQRVASVSEMVKQRDLQKSVEGLENYLKKKAIIDQRFNLFIKQKKEKSINRSITTPKTNRSSYERISNASFRFDEDNFSYRRKPVAQSSQSTERENKMREKLSNMKQKHEEKKVSSLMNKMRQIQVRLAQRQILKHSTIEQKKKVPIKCLTDLRNTKQQTKRQQVQRIFEQKLKSMDQKILELNRSKQETVYNKSFLSTQHSKTVNFRKKVLQQQQTNKKMTNSRMYQTALSFKRERSEKILLLKRQFKLKKQYQQQKNAQLMKKLVGKLNDLKLVDSNTKLPNSEIYNFSKLLEQIVDPSKKADILAQTKFNVATKILQDAQAQSKIKKQAKKIL